MACVAGAEMTGRASKRKGGRGTARSCHVDESAMSRDTQHFVLLAGDPPIPVQTPVIPQWHSLLSKQAVAKAPW